MKAAKNENLMGIVAAVMLKAGAAACSFLLFSLASNTRSGDEFGTFAIILSAASMMMVLAAFGQEMMVIRIWNEHGASNNSSMVKGGILSGFFTCLFGGALAGIVLGAYFGVSESAGLGVAVGLFVASLTLLAFTTHLGRVVFGVLVGDGNRDILVLAPAIIVLGLSLFFLGDFSNTSILFIMAGSNFIGVTGLLTAVYFRMKRAFPAVLAAKACYDFGKWRSTSVSLWGASLLESSNQYLDVVLLGFLMNPMAAGIYFIATRLANVFLTAASAMHAFGSKKIPHNYYHKLENEMSQTLKTMAGMTGLIVVGGLLCVAVLGEWALGIFGDEYIEFYGVLMVLCIGTASVTAIGASPVILMVTGYEKNYLKALAISVATRLVGFVVLVPIWGIYGAAIGATFSLLLMAFLLATSAKRLTGLDGTVLRFLAPTPAARS